MQSNFVKPKSSFGDYMKQLIMSVLLSFGFSTALPQDMWKYFTPDDFAKRRSAVMEKIGDDIAVFLGAEMPEAYVKFRQDNTFYYLTGVEVPDAVLIINGKRRSSTLLVPEDIPNDIKDEARFKPGKEAAALYKVDRVLSRDQLTQSLGWTLVDAPTVYLYLAPEETAGMSPDRGYQTRMERIDDPWDGRVPKETNFANLIKQRFPEISVKDISPIIHRMRWVKDEKEIAVLSECGRIGALGFNEAMKITKPGVYEYQLAAACDFYYQYNGQQNPAFLPIAASGERGLTWHYNANNHPLKSGDVVLLDYAPDLAYYVTDITRTWPVNGTFDEYQSKMYECIKEARANIIAMMKPGVTYAEMQAVGKAAYEKHGFGKFWFGYVGHHVGMAVHDVGPRGEAFVPGVVFNVEPIIEDKEKKIHLRLEDTIVITANGAEVLTGLTPVDAKEIKRLIDERGLFE